MVFMRYEETVLVKVDKETKNKMKKIKTNWSEAIRAAIAEEISRQKNLAKAIAQTYEILGSQKKKRSDESTKIVRYWRDRRYGTASR
jgi:hypothetical protein